MTKLAQVAAVFAIGIAWNSFASAQEAPQYNVVNCVKVRDGKNAEYEAFIRNTGMKLNKVRVDNGTYAAVIYAQAAFPAGRAARCDYDVVLASNGFPAEAPTTAQNEADMKKAGLSMSYDAMLAKRNDLTYLVSTEMWRGQAMVGAGVTKGGYARVNYYKTKPNMAADWLHLETAGWKKLAESVAQDMPGMSWSVWTLVMPGGASLPYNAMTVDGFPNWDAVAKGVPARAIWNKVHPDQDFSQYMDKISDTIDRPRTDLMRIVEMITK